MNSNQRSQTVIVALVAAALIPRIQKWFGITLTLQDIGDLMTAAVVVWHSACAVFERYFPPPRAIEAASVPLVPSQSPGAKI